MPGTSKKWKVRPIGVSAGIAQNTALNREWNGGFWRCCCYLIKYQQAKTIVKEF